VIPCRILKLTVVGALAIGGTSAWAYAANHPRTKPVCHGSEIDPRNPPAPPPQLSPAEQARVAQVGLADPLVQTLLNGFAPQRADSLGKPGYRVHPKFVFDRGPIGRTGMLLISLPKPLPDGTYQWLAFESKFPNDCFTSRPTWLRTQLLEGSASGTGTNGSPQLTARRLNIEVSLRTGRVLMVMGESYSAENFSPVGEPEYLFGKP
jgi:hypothetical protein